MRARRKGFVDMDHWLLHVEVRLSLVEPGPQQVSLLGRTKIRSRRNFQCRVEVKML
jgi:hypothetical protein